MDKIELSATGRTVLGKKVKALRREGITPINLYGSNVASTALQVDSGELKRTLTKAGKSSLVNLKVSGSKQPRMVVFRDIQRHPLTRNILHVDLYQVKMEEKLKISVPLTFMNEAPAIRDRGGILVQNMSSIEVECLPTDMPHSIDVDLSVLHEIDQALHVKDLSVADNITILTDGEQSIVQIARSKVEAIEASEAAAAEEAEPAAEE